ncbi:MAG: hypothetical protein R3297_06750 [Desulfobulbales bacterium]|nr:hypothetical protein [Desulfobulbales bacterium]
MNDKAILFTVAIFLAFGLLSGYGQVNAAETRKDIPEVKFRGLEIPASRKKKKQADEYVHRHKRQNFTVLGKSKNKNFKHIKFIKVAAQGTFPELQLLYEEKKTRINFRNQKGETALIKVLDGPFNEDTFLKLQFLISAGVNLNVRGKSAKSENTSSLGVAIYNSAAVFRSGHGKEVQVARKILQLLIDAGAAVASLEADGRSLLHLAVATNNLFAAELLLESGVKVLPIDDYHITPLDISETREMIILLKKYQAKEVT